MEGENGRNEPAPRRQVARASCSTLVSAPIRPRERRVEHARRPLLDDFQDELTVPSVERSSGMWPSIVERPIRHEERLGWL